MSEDSLEIPEGDRTTGSGDGVNDEALVAELMGMLAKMRMFSDDMLDGLQMATTAQLLSYRAVIQRGERMIGDMRLFVRDLIKAAVTGEELSDSDDGGVFNPKVRYDDEESE